MMKFETLTTYNRQPLPEAFPDVVVVTDADPARIADAKALILSFLDRDGTVCVHDVYAHPSDPLDGDLYDAVTELLAEGKVKGPAIESCRSHHDMVYTKVETVDCG